MPNRIIYIDPITFHCYLSQNESETRIVYETDFFNGKCDVFVEGYQIIPFGYELRISDDIVYKGEMIAPWKDYAELDSAQREYERQKLADAENALAILLGGAV